MCQWWSYSHSSMLTKYRICANAKSIESIFVFLRERKKIWVVLRRHQLRKAVLSGYIYELKYTYEFSGLTPSSFPWSKWTAPARWMPGRNHTGCVSNRRSNRPRSHGGLVESPDVSLVDVSPSANIPPSELDTNDARDWNWDAGKKGKLEN